MDFANRCKMGRSGLYKGERRGPSSFMMQDPDIVFKELDLKEGDCVLDMGCGAGDYALEAARIVSSSGRVYALDLWEDMICNLAEAADSMGLKNVEAAACDITKRLPVCDCSVDVCLISNVLHALDFENIKVGLLEEVRRVLKPGGRLVVIEIKNDNAGFGPPIQKRISHERIEEEGRMMGLEAEKLSDIGYNYLIQLRKI